MNGLMMDYPLTLSTIFRRGETIYRRQEIVSRLADKSIHRYTMGDFTHRARRLARALLDLGIVPGDRVATLGWNHGAHLEAYFAIPLIRGGPPHAQSPPAPRRARLHRQSRGRQAAAG